MEQFVNNGISTLTADITSTQTTIPVANGAVFPSEGEFRLRIDDEIIIATSRSGNTITASGRSSAGAEGTTRAAHTTGAEVRNVLTAASLAAIILERKKAPTIEDYGGKAQVGFDNTSALHNALDDAGNIYWHVDFRAGQTYEFDGKVTVPNKTSMGIDGATLKCTASPDVNPFIEFKWGSGQGTDGGIYGQGRIEGNLCCTWVIGIDSWRGGHFRDFSFGNGTFGGMILQDNNGVDCDSNSFFGINHRTTTSLGVDDYDVTKVAFRLQGSGGRVTDNEFYSPVIIGGLRPCTHTAGVANNDGGIGYEIINADRNTFVNPKTYSHFTTSDGQSPTKSLKWNYAFKIHADVDTAGGNVIVNPYSEATTIGGNPDGTANTTWNFWVLHVTMDAGFNCDWTQVSGAQMTIDASGARGKRAQTTGAGTMHGFQWLHPKSSINVAGQMDLDAGMTGGLVHVHTAAEVSRVTLNGGTGVNVVDLSAL
jgi:hypothetical protein